MEFNENRANAANYDDDSIRHLSDVEHIRLRPGMYIGKLGDGSQSDDGIYVLLKEVVDNCIDEFKMGFGKRIEIDIIDNHTVTVRDYGRGIPQGMMIQAVSKLNTGAKYDDKVFQKSVGLNGVGLKAVNATSTHVEVRSYREGVVRIAKFEKGILVSDTTEKTNDENGTYISFTPDNTLYRNFEYRDAYIETLLRNYTYLNTGRAIMFNGKRIVSRNGLVDLLSDRMTHAHHQYGEEYYSFVNGQHTSQGGMHQIAFKELVAQTIHDFFSAKNFDYCDIRNGIVAAIAVNIQEPVFESQTKTKLGSTTIAPDAGSMSVKKFISDFIKEELDNFLHKNPEISDVILAKITASEKERKELAGLTKQVREKAKKVNLHNRKLRDCRIHYNDAKGDRLEESCIFITEGDSASGSITKSRDANTQAVFSLRGKPLNCFGLSRAVVYQNEEFNLLQAALNIEDGLEGLRYNKVIVATDADVDGMHIRLLMITFFLQFFPELIKKGHVYILQTPLFRVRNKRKLPRGKKGAGERKENKGDFETIYCYSEEERLAAIEKLSPNPEITRFKGLGEISPDEFRNFIGPDMRLERVELHKDDKVEDLLAYYMGKNTMERQNFIIDNLVVEEDKAGEEI